MTDTITRPREETKRKIEGMPPYNVVLLDDDDHSFEYVVRMLKTIFGHPLRRGFKMALQVDMTGRVIVATVNLEQAELKRDQIHAFGAEKGNAKCKGSMKATIEPER